MKAKETVEILDDSGDPHTYHINYHPAKEGLDLLPKVTKIAAQAVVPMLSETTKSAMSNVDMDDYDFGSGSSPDDIEDMIKDDLGGSLDMSDMDTDTIVQGVNGFVEEIISEGKWTLVEELLKHTERCEEGDKRPVFVVEDEQKFNEAYTGNFGELFRALYQVVKVNFGPALSSTLGVQI